MQRTVHWDYGALQVHKLYLECSHPELNHDNIIGALMMALTAIRGNSIAI